MPVTYSDDGQPRARITVTNYERIERFNMSDFVGVVLDESSILKSHDGKTRTYILEATAKTPYRLACTATPAPNDIMELANHAEFMGVMTRNEMLSCFFVHDGGETQKWRLKRHATKPFWEWVSSWAVFVRKPSDLSYEDGPFTLPPITIEQVVVESNFTPEGFLFPVEAQSLSERIAARRESIGERVRMVADIVARRPDEQWLIWCDLNGESDALKRAIPGSTEVRGSDSDQAKTDNLLGFAEGAVRVLITKPKIGGFGMNWQNCHNVIFCGLSDSWEQYYQAIRRCWRFGQSQDVHVWIVTTASSGAVAANIRRKEQQATDMYDSLVSHTRKITERNIRKQETSMDDTVTLVKTAKGRCFDLSHGDSSNVMAAAQDNSVDYILYSPPFESLYTYSNSVQDLGNCRSSKEFMEHYQFLLQELYRVLRPGRLLSIHCMNLPTSKVRDGVIGLRDFRGEQIRAVQATGMVFHSEVVIWKDPVTAMQRTKALGLLYKQLRKDSAMSRMGIPDYLVTFRKLGENAAPVTKKAQDFPCSRWQRYASPVWMDINQSDTLQRTSVREHEDERHICPLQLGVIRRSIELWTNPDDLVLDPFAGIGSTGVVALEMGRRFQGVELKESYYKQAVANLEHTESVAKMDLFTGRNAPEIDTPAGDAARSNNQDTERSATCSDSF